MGLNEPEAEHFGRILPRTRFVVGAGIVAYLLLLAWTYFSVVDLKIFLLQAIAALIIAISAFLAGNTYRLRDVRRRQAYQLSQLDPDDKESRKREWAKLVPPTTIAFRFRLAVTGLIAGAIGQICIILLFVQRDDIITGIVATFLVLVLAGLIFLAGTYARPVD